MRKWLISTCLLTIFEIVFCGFNLPLFLVVIGRCGFVIKLILGKVKLPFLLAMELLGFFAALMFAFFGVSHWTIARLAMLFLIGLLFAALYTVDNEHYIYFEKPEGSDQDARKEVKVQSIAGSAFRDK